MSDTADLMKRPLLDSHTDTKVKEPIMRVLFNIMQYFFLRSYDRA